MKKIFSVGTAGPERRERKGDIPMRTRHPTIGASSELETCAHVFWNVLERQLLVSASCECVSDSALRRWMVLTAPSFGGSKTRSW